MFEIESTVIAWVTEAAHNPAYLYAIVITVLTLSSFGLPIPEEVVLLTSGFAANIAIQEAGGLENSTLNPYTLAAVCFFAVYLSDSLVFFLGRWFGTQLLRKPPFTKFLSDEAYEKILSWTSKYGALACALFRFTPALRFPGHFMCGALKISYLKFTLTDGVAALLTVPSQVILIALYGDQILSYLKQFKLAIIIALFIFLFIWVFRRLPKHLDEVSKT